MTRQAARPVSPCGTGGTAVRSGEGRVPGDMVIQHFCHELGERSECPVTCPPAIPEHPSAAETALTAPSWAPSHPARAENKQLEPENVGQGATICLAEG